MCQKKKINHYNVGNWYGKPYHFFGDYLYHKFGAKILKLSINANLGCPNRDGTIDTGGCIFCSLGSASPTAEKAMSIHQQMQAAVSGFNRGMYTPHYIAYFQAFTNTYASVDILKKLYDSALEFNNVVGLMIGTRPDCVPDDVLDLIASYKKSNFELWLEIGMQSMHEKSLSLLNRGHTHSQTIDAIMRASKRGIPVCVHVILGIPSESWDDMMATANEISKLPISGVKIHHLHVIKGTPLEMMYNSGAVNLLSFKQYVSYVCDFIERLRGDIIIHRLLGDQPKDMLVAPAWGLHKGTVLKAIEDELLRRGTYQGFLCDSY
ncbi:MAG: TIGR01212 family radical SAM protein [Spirochaetes bacterium]|nr:TIGR01212 family radical SAM protein [Spirochaetota bacterium]